MRGFIFDLDGTVYLGGRLIDGAVETIERIRNRGDRVVFLTNKPIATRQSYAEKLSGMGIKTSVDDVLNSSLIVARYLQRIIKPNESVFVIGERPIYEELWEHDIKTKEHIDGVSYVVLSWDREFTYDKLNLVYQAAIQGSTIIASNPDVTCPMDDGQIPDTGSFIAALEAATGKPIDIIAGKPSLFAAQSVADYLEMDYADCYMIGDRLDTDIKMGSDTGMTTVLVLTGVSTAEMVKKSPYQPTHVVASIKDVVNL